MNLGKFLQSKKLTLFANDLSLDELKVLAPLFPPLKEVVIFGAGTECQTTYLVSLLPKLRLSETGIVPILKKLNSNFHELSIQSTRLTPQGVDAVISALPSTLESLHIKGIAIGERAKEKFRQHAKEQEAHTGLKLELDE